MSQSSVPRDNLPLKLVAERFICGGSAITSGRSISRKRLALIGAHPNYPDIEAKLLFNEIAAYRNAKSILQTNDLISPDVLLRAHSCFYSKKFKMGRFRTTQNWIGESLKKAQYIPPNPEQLQLKLTAWFKRLNSHSGSLDNIISLYAEFILLHPFPDANGRLARALFDVLSENANDLRLEQKLPLALYRLHVEPSHYISGLHAFGTKSNSGTTHKYWQDAIDWSNKTGLQIHQLFLSSKQNIQNKIGIFAITKEEAQVLDTLWLYPIVTPLFLNNTFGWHISECEALLQKLCGLGLLTTKNLKHGNNSLVFVCDLVFDFFEKADALILKNQNKLKY